MTTHFPCISLHRSLVKALAGLALVALLVSFAARGDSETSPAPRDDLREGSLLTLNWIDDLRSSFSFRGGHYSLMFQDGELRNHGSDITFHRYVPDSLVSGIEGDVKSVLIDLGDLRTAGTAMSVLPFLVRDGDSIGYRGMKEVSLAGPATKQAAAKVTLGHIYVLRIENQGESRHVAMRVVEYHPGQSVTLRWRAL